MSSIWTDEQARRLFPIIALGGTAGAVIGPIITRSLIGVIGMELLLMVSATLLIVAVVCVQLLGNWSSKFGTNRHVAGNEAALGGGILDGLKQVFSNSFVAGMSLMMLLNDAIGTIAYVLITDYSGTAFPHNAVAQTRFAASMDLSANIIQIIVQLTVTRWLLVRYGAGVIFCIWSAILVYGCLTMTFVKDPFIPVLGSMPIVALVLIMARSLSYGMLQPARETLYTLVPREIRYKGKNVVDTVVWRAGDVLSLLSLNGFRVLGISVSGLGIIWATFAVHQD